MLFIASTDSCVLHVTVLNYCLSDSSLLSPSVSSIKLCHWTTSGEIACYPKESKFEGNLLTVKEEKRLARDLPGRATSKPEVYRALVKLLSSPGQWIFDPIGGAGVFLGLNSVKATVPLV